MARGSDRAARAVNNPDLLVERTRRYGVRGLKALAQDIDADTAAVRSAPNPTMKRDDQKSSIGLQLRRYWLKADFLLPRTARGGVSQRGTSGKLPRTGT